MKWITISILICASFFAPSLSAYAQAPADKYAQPREVPPARWEELKRDEAFWYSREAWKEAEAPEEPVVTTHTSSPSFLKNFVTVLLIMGGLAALIYLLYRTGILGPRGGTIKEPAPQAELEEGCMDRDMKRAIGEAVERGDFRAALRWHHLQLLAALHRAGYIRYDEGRTDRDYRSDLEGTSFEGDWTRLSRLYAWSWYGRHPLPEPLYRQWAPQYDQLLGRLGL